MTLHLSIVVPAFNVEKHIEATLFSIFEQTLPVSQVIIINDGSTDKTPQIIKKFLADYSPINWFFYEQENKGVSATRNIGLTKSNSDYILFLDADDCIEKNLSSSIQYELQKEADLIFWPFEPCSIPQISLPDNENLNGFRVFSEMYVSKKIWIWIGATAYKKRFLEINNIKFTENCVNGEDQEFLMKALAHAKKVSPLRETKSFYNFRENSISNQYQFRKFDSVIAVLRGSQYLEKVLNIEENTIAKDILYSEYHLFFKINLFILFSKKIKARAAINQILDSIKSNYSQYQLEKIQATISNDTLAQKTKNFFLKKHPEIYACYIFLKYKNYTTKKGHGIIKI